jgi:hypothetical protein
MIFLSPLRSAAATWATRPVPRLPGMRLGNFIRVRLRAAAAASTAYPLAGHPSTLEDETLRRMPTIWTDNCIDGHETSSRRAAGGRYQTSPPARLLRGRSPPQTFADELRSLDKGMELVLRDISLEQDQAAVSCDAKPLGRDHP